jgi:nanoRNase/pAp phosphatase (c-di-AMP/oligoRNAs hydrolase)
LKQSARKLLRLQEALKGRRKLLVLTHDNPDPDSIASAWILGRIARKLGMPRTVLGYGGIVGRTENRTMIDVLRIPLKPLAQLEVGSFDAIALVDTQPRAGNNSLPAERPPDLVFDHHPCRRATRDIAFYDIREEYGATTTILYEYLEAAELPTDRRIATAVFHAIRSETQNLGREAGRPDAQVFLACFPFVDNQALSRIEHAPLKRGWFAMIDRAIDGTHLYGGIAVTHLGKVDTPDMVAQFADLIVRLEGIDWALCIGRFRSDLLLSIRTNRRRANAGRVIRGIVSGLGTAGGHDMIAGGKVAGGALTAARARRVEQLLVRRLLRELGALGVRPSHLTRSMTA